MGFNLSKLLAQAEGMKSIQPVVASSGLLGIGQTPDISGAPSAYTITPGEAVGSGDAQYWTQDTYTPNQAYLDYINARQGAAPSATAQWVPASFYNADSASVNPGSSGNPWAVSGGFWNEPDPDGSGWGSQLSSGLKDFAASPVAPIIAAMVTGGLSGLGDGAAGAAASEGSGLAAAGNAAAAPISVGAADLSALAIPADLSAQVAAAAGSGGINSGLLAAAQQAAAPITAGGADFGLLGAIPADLSAQVAAAAGAGAGVGSGLAQAMQQASQPITVSGLTSAEQAAMMSTPQIGAASAVPSVFNAAADSQAASSQLGITGSQAASAATVPTTVNLVNAGGTMATAGGLAGATSQAAQALRDATASSELGGTAASQLGSQAASALSSAGSGIGTAAQWLKENPTLGRLLFAGGSALLNTLGSGSSSTGSTGTKTYGAPVQWSSSPTALNQGLLSGGLLGQNVKQIQPQMPTGLLGNPDSGAWRYLKG